MGERVQQLESSQADVKSVSHSNIKDLSNDQLLHRVGYLVRQERKLVETLIWHLQEVQNRKLFLELGYTSLFECLVKHFKYSESVAYSRISVIKIINEVPSVSEGLASGELNLTNLAMVQSFIRKQEKETHTNFTKEEKTHLVTCLKNKSSKEVKEILAEMSPVSSLPDDQIKFLSGTHVQIQITAKKEILEKVEYLKSLISHENINPTYSELLELALDAAIEKIEKKKGIHLKGKKAELENSRTEGKNQNSIDDVKDRDKDKVKDKEPTPTQSFAVRNSRYISRTVRRVVLDRAQHQCEYVHPNGRRCSSKYQLQYDHIKAFSHGGASVLANIQVLCRMHNAAKSGRDGAPIWFRTRCRSF